MVGADENLAGMKCHPLFLIPTVADFILNAELIKTNFSFSLIHQSRNTGLERNPLFLAVCLRS